MTVLPVVAREMSVMARRKSMYWSRWLTAIVALLVMLWLLVLSSSSISFSELGASIFFILTTLCFVFTAVAGMQATADCLSEEKREGTLGLLFLTDLKGFDVIAGKLAASSFHAVLVLIGIIPMLSLAFLLGGVTLQQFGLVALVLCNTLFLSLSLGVLVSSVSENERKAMVGAFVCLFVLFFGPFLLTFALRNYLGPINELPAASPIYSFAAVHHPGSGTFQIKYFWPSLVWTHLLAWLFLFCAALILPRCINPVPSRRLLRLRNFVDKFVYGRNEQRRKHRATLLDRNAFLWLASRERIKPKYAWLIIGFFLGLYAWIYLQFDDMLFDLMVGTAMMLLIHLVLKVWVASEVCSRLIQDRRSGALELLLSTPLSVRDIAKGQSMALRRVFLKPILLLLLLEVVLFISGLNLPRQLDSRGVRTGVYIALIGTFLADLWALKWVGLWLSLTGKSIERVLLATLLRVLVLPWLIYALFAGFTGARFVFGMGHFNPSSPILSWAFLAVLIALALGSAARYQFLNKFRELAARRFDSPPEPDAIQAPASHPAMARPRLRLLDLYLRRPLTNSIILFLLLTVLFLWGRAQYWSYRIKSEIRAVQAAGFPTTLSEASQYHPAPPARENVFALLAETGLNQGGPSRPRPRTIKGREQSPEQIKSFARARAEEILQANQAQLSILRKLPSCKIAYIDPLTGNWPNTRFLHMGYRSILEADVLLSAYEDSELAPVRAERAIRAFLAYARLTRRQPLIFAEHFASESLRGLGVALEDVFARDILRDEVLLELQRELESVDDPAAVTRTLALQRAYFLDPPPSTRNLFTMVAPRGGTAIATLQKFMEATGSREKQRAQLLGLYQEAFAFAARPYPARAEALGRLNDPSLARIYFGARGQPLPFGHPRDVFYADANFTTHLHLLRTLFALERHERKHGQVPATPAALVPEFLPAVPLDPYSGGPVKFLPRDNFLWLYSLGMDRDDDTVTGNSSKGADLFLRFPMPASASQ